MSSKPQVDINIIILRSKRERTSKLYLGVDSRKLAGLTFAMGSLRDVTKLICELPRRSASGLDVHLLNAYSIALSESNPTYRSCLEASALNLPDGKPLSIITKLTKQPLGHVRGPSLFESVMDKGREHGIRHYLLGTTDATLKRLENSLNQRHPGVQIVGMMSPPFRELTQQEIRQQDYKIRDSSPDIVWVGLGTPKQDFEARRLAKEGGFLAIAVGAAFDFSAGTKKPAPQWVTKIGAEWLYRFAAEPRRLWRRYLIGNFVFLKAIGRHGLNR